MTDTWICRIGLCRLPAKRQSGRSLLLSARPLAVLRCANTRVKQAPWVLRCCSPEFDQIARKAGRDYSTDLRLRPRSVAKLGGEYGPLQTEGDKRGNNPAAGLFEWNVPAMEDLIGGWPKLSKEQEDAVAEAMAGSGRISRRCFFGGGGATAAGKRDRKYRAIRRSVRSRLAVGSGPHGENNR